MGKLFTEDEENFILENWENFSNKELAEIIGRDIKDAQIRGWLQHHGIWRRGKNTNVSCKFSEQDVSFIIDNYQNMEYKEIAKELGFTERQVRGKINNMGLTKLRKINGHYFDVIDDSEKAYFLGFIYADGWVVFNTERKNYEFGIELQSQDKYILELLNERLGKLNKIIHFEGGERFIVDRICNKSDTDCLRVYSKSLVEGLMNNGVVTNKSLKPIHPEVDDKFFPDFLRGYIDGDGWYSKVKEYTYMGLTCGNEVPLQYIKSKLKDFGIETKLYKETDKKYCLMCCSIIEMSKLINFLYYSNDVICLSRKYEKIKHYLAPLCSDTQLKNGENR